MDEEPNCSYSTEPTTQKSTQKDELKSQKDHTTISETESTELKGQTVLVKEYPVNFDEQTTVLKIQPIHTVDQPSDSKDQPTISKDETTAHIRIISTKHQRSSSEDRIAVPIHRIDPSIKISQSAPSLTVIQADAAKDESTSSEEQIFVPIYHIGSDKGETSTSKSRTAAEIHPSTAKDESGYSGGQAIAQINQIASSRGESSALKKVVASIGNSSGRKSPLNADLDFFSCVEKGASATLSFTNNCYLLSSNAPLKINSCTQSPALTQPAQPPLPATVAVGTQPPSLFLQALSKLDESSLTLSVVSHFGVQAASPNLSRVYNVASGDITPPDSLTSAPPTFSFVLRQMAARRRPKYMGTFIPSPSFVQQTPPPTYTGAYDVYIEPSMPPPQSRVYTYGFTSMLIVCPECGFTGMTAVTSHVTFCTHLCAFVLCLLCCWACAPLPYILRSCKDVYHYCRNCRSFLGMYCPTNPENVYPNV